MKVSQKNNGGFPPLVLKNDKKNTSNKERFFVANIHQILETKNNKNILNKEKEDDNDTLEVVTDL